MWGFEGRIGPFPLSAAQRRVYSHTKESSVFKPMFYANIWVTFPKYNGYVMWFVPVFSWHAKSFCVNTHEETTTVSSPVSA